MIDAVLLFGVINIVFEFVLLTMLSPRYRLRVLGNPILRNMLHVLFLSGNLIIHWGTLIGTMSAILAFVASIVTVQIARTAYGYVTDEQYHVGLKRYSLEQLT